MSTTTLLYAQSGGPTAVINATAAAVIGRAQARGARIIGARNGVLGIETEDLVELGTLDRDQLRVLAQTPGSALGACRVKLPKPEADPARFQRLFEVLRAHQVDAVLYNGGNDSADTALKLASAAQTFAPQLRAIAVPKTIDNDLVETDTCPGFGSVAKYVATSTLEATLDVRAMARTSTKVFVLEVMGRHAGWIAAAGGLVERLHGLPVLVLFPEAPFEAARFLAAVASRVERHGYCSVVVSEGLRGSDGRFLSEAGTSDAFGHAQLGGVGPYIAALVARELKFKTHSAVADYLQRAARHLASNTDYALAQRVGRAAVDYALRGLTSVMPCIRRSDSQSFGITPVALEKIANRERKLPRSFLRADGFGISKAGEQYLKPLIAGQARLRHVDGLPEVYTDDFKPLRRLCG